MLDRIPSLEEVTKWKNRPPQVDPIREARIEAAKEMWEHAWLLAIACRQSGLAAAIRVLPIEGE